MKPKNGGRTSTVTSRARRDWEEATLRPALGKRPERRKEFTTVSNLPIERLYSAEDLKGWVPVGMLSFPWEPTITRGVHPTTYRGRLWTMRQFAGFGTAEDTNRRFHYHL